MKIGMMQLHAQPPLPAQIWFLYLKAGQASASRQMHYCVVAAVTHLHLGAQHEYQHYVATGGAACPPRAA